MRLAAIYDIHANLPAMEAVLAEINEVAPDLILVGGDVASGPMPTETIDRLIAVGDRAYFIMGNADRSLVSPYDNTPEDDSGQSDAWRARGIWASRQVTAAHRDFLSGFHENAVFEVDGHGDTLFCHGSPRSDEEILTASTSEIRAREALFGVGERTVVCGHTHVQFDRIVGGIRVINPGSVGMPYEGKPGAYWALFGPDVTFRRTEYDLDVAARMFRKSGYPEVEEFLQDIILSPPSASWATEFFERQAAERSRAGEC